ncbi:MAG TPA: hypothetical protein VJ201_06545 [Candidatus Babeliales bacterium]|nr:hypothetical protein [Candidatus Babeliales bacterium]HLC06687.1 hypothetical protein [Candidatus Babeliales bacterium]
MKLLDPIKSFINKTDLKTFYTYIIGYSATCVVLVVLIIVYYYSSTNALQKKIKNINATREEVLEILEKYALIKQQQLIVEEILAKDPNFKIAGYFKDLLLELNLKDKEVAEEITTTDLEENYRKSELSAKFEGMTMQDLTRLLEKIEQNPRVATNRLEITKSKKKPKTIEVGLAISTLLPKIESTSI